MIFSKGDKVVVVKDDWLNSLTQNSVYEVIDTLGRENQLIAVCNKHGRKSWYPKEYFELHGSTILDRFYE